ncbi:MAG: hypothetical protein GYB68_05045 [Chloroflexi bacterium]|nr:hypothetical protein [Chloroflexota bacterium]
MSYESSSGAGGLSTPVIIGIATVVLLCICLGAFGGLLMLGGGVFFSLAGQTSPVNPPGPGLLGDPGNLNLDAPPMFGVVDLTGGFETDPTTIDIVTGGTVEASNAVGIFCNGYVPEIADVVLEFDGTSADVLRFTVESDADTTLVVRDPSGAYTCDDDSAGDLNPEVVIFVPQAGTYRIWVGTFLSEVYADAVLSISGTE